MSKLKVITVVGTRPEIIRLSRIIPKLDQFTNHTLVHTGQNYDYELNQIFFKDLNLRKPDYFLNAADVNATKTIGKILIKIDDLLEKINPDALLVLGDTNSCMAIIAAKKRQIPTFHFEAGNRCFDMRVPEEINRKIVDHTADVNMTYSTIARDYLISEGIPKDLVIKIGSPMFEVIDFYKKKIRESKILKDLNLDNNNYFLASFHREENINSSNFEKIINILNNLVNLYNLEVVVSTHPRTRNKINESNCRLNKKIILIKPQSFTDYIQLQLNARLVLSDSGTINEESSILNFPAINIRETHERPEAMEETAVMMTGVNSERVRQAIDILIKSKKGDDRKLDIVKDYQCKNISEKVLRIIISYTDYIQRKTWKKFL
ncbi:non-hydrolyzing UDP-N-acetylglucosamine 2-epimerase [uncultured Prochlorococcus sp.]|uniref:non-hydrolyzing UDP-N-acetylglucosamine 2-epimerase n=1 Tax=uncultured Prochlorococcus sp. TaxID=159733 RepID=UPI0025854356|nr:UDP-N-acetylglucosamine 2-epimerase (non-hydrolyzing) [uncultured Prochlorococcus sp.]